jgi:hypothetical protein
MMRAFHLQAAACAALLATVAPAATQNALTAEQWRQDLRFLANELPRRHRDPFTRTTRAAFDSAVAALDQRIPALRDHEVVVGMASLVAMLRDGHTRLTLPEDTALGWDRAHTTTPPPRDSSLYFHHLPVRFALFSDGLFVTAATAEHRGLIGSRVVSIGGVAADAALQRVRGVVHADNEMGYRMVSPTRLAIPEVLHALGIARGLDEASIEVERAGRRRAVTLQALRPFSGTRILEAREIGPAALSERHLDRRYWMELIPRGRVLYVQFNEISDGPDESVAAFARRMERLAADSGAERLILDLRHNPGGDNGLSRGMLLALTRSERLNRFGRLYTLIGRETFSAAQMLANDLERLTNTLFVGEPSGSSPSAYGDSRRFQLPNSGLTVRASSIYWRDMSGNERRPWTDPDLPVEVSSADYFAGRDPVLEAALAHQPADLAALVGGVARSAGVDRAARIILRLRTDGWTADEALEPALLAGGEALLQRGPPADAVAWYGMTVRFAPGSAAGYEGLSRAHRAAGDAQRAEDAARRARELRGTAVVAP